MTNTQQKALQAARDAYLIAYQLRHLLDTQISNPDGVAHLLQLAGQAHKHTAAAITHLAELQTQIITNK